MKKSYIDDITDDYTVIVIDKRDRILIFQTDNENDYKLLRERLHKTHTVKAWNTPKEEILERRNSELKKITLLLATVLAEDYTFGELIEGNIYFRVKLTKIIEVEHKEVVVYWDPISKYIELYRKYKPVPNASIMKYGYKLIYLVVETK